MKPPHPDSFQLDTDERCDRSHVERARILATLHKDGKTLLLTFCRYHYRQYEIPLRMAGWTMTEL